MLLHLRRLYIQKHKKKPMFKNGVKSRLTLFFKEFWAVFVQKTKKTSWRVILEKIVFENYYAQKMFSH